MLFQILKSIPDTSNSPNLLIEKESEMAREMKYWWTVLILVLASGCVNATETPPIPLVSLSADPSIEQASLESFDGLTKSELWHDIDELDYWALPFNPPTEYYQSVDQMSAATLRASLHEIIDDHSVFYYSHYSLPQSNSHKIDTWDIIMLADGHPEDTSQVIDLYLNNTFGRQYKGPQTDPRYDREHSWPKSLGFKKDTKKNPAYSDCHHLFAAYSSYNSSRSNNPYGEDDINATARRMTMENLGRGGSLTDEPYTSNYSFDDSWQTWIGRRGDVARAMFYMDVRYEGEVIGNVGEPDLVLTNDVNKITIRNDAWKTGAKGYMGILDVLLKWHEQDPVDDLERRRNTVVYLFQENRNPFIDHPEWVNIVFGGGSITPPQIVPVVWINEIHYDNAGTDHDEFVEIAGTAGLDLAGWRLIAYNGNGGRAYASVALSGTMPDLSNGLGVMGVNFPNMQNGSPDGIALVDSSGQLVQFISYEGSFTATDGIADDQVSEDIGTSENSSTSIGYSLQLTGQGRRYSDFTWQQPSTATKGQINNGQSF